MRNLRNLNKYRYAPGDAMRGITPAMHAQHGVFQIPLPGNEWMHNIIANSGEGWDHVSVSYKGRVPTWEEMDKIKRMFFKDDEVAMQLHVTPEDHVNIHPNVLHLWRPTDREIPLPPKAFV